MTDIRYTLSSGITHTSYNQNNVPRVGDNVLLSGWGQFMVTGVEWLVVPNSYTPPTVIVTLT